MRRMTYILCGMTLSAAVAMTMTSCADTIAAGEIEEIAAPAHTAIRVGNFPSMNGNPSTRSVAGADSGKTEWTDGDNILLQLNGTDWYTLTYSAESGEWSLPEGVALPEVESWKAIYSPRYLVGSDGGLRYYNSKDVGTEEFLSCSGTTPEVDIKFTRDYSRLRIYCGAEGVSLNVSFSDGFSVADTGSKHTGNTFTMKSDSKGNAYMYGSWTAGTTFTIGAPEVDDEAITFRESGDRRLGVDSQANVSYALSLEELSVDVDLDKITPETMITNEKIAAITDYGYTRFIFKGTYDTDKIADDAFRLNVKIRTIDLSGVRGYKNYIAADEFMDCSSMSGLLLPDDADIESIGNYGFYNCRSLSLTSLPSTVKSVGNSAFAYCGKLSLTSLPPLLTTIENCAFYGCGKLSLTMLPDGVTSIGDGAFSGCTLLALTALPEEVSFIGDDAFYECASLSLTSLPDKVEYLGEYSFFGCEALRLSALPKALTEVSKYAFYGCKALTEMTFHSGITSIGVRAFYGCDNLSKVTFEADELPAIGTDAFGGTAVASLNTESK